jgi:alpha-L-fucosidase
MKTFLRLTLTVLAFAVATNTVLAQTGATRYEADWSSLDARPLPSWYDDAKFGIFIHWGVYSVPAFGPTGDDVGIYAKYAEWYWNRWSDPDAEGNAQFRAFHDRVFGKGTQYQDFAHQFKAELFDPDQWADLFARAGARYVVLTSKHHEGFALWPSEHSWNWNSVDVGPHRDIAGELTNAVRKHGLRMGFYYSLYEWFNPLYRSNLQQYIDTHMWPQLKDLVNRYEPDVIWPDGEWDHESSVWKSEEFLAWLYNESPVRESVVVNDRWGKETRSLHGGFYTTEYSLVHNDAISDEAARHKWEECRGIGGSFGFNRMENLDDYSTSEDLIHLLVNVVSRGGNLLLNVGPTADGRIPVIMQQRLADMGKWLEVNGEAIYGTRPWYEAKEVENVRSTRKGDTLYATTLSWPGRELVLPGVNPDRNATVTLLGYDQPLKWRTRGGNLVIEVPVLSVDEVPTLYAHSFRITDAL